MGRSILCLAVLCSASAATAQDVYISIPATNIFNRSEFTTVQNVLNTGRHSNWRIGFLNSIDPTVRSLTNDFTHTTHPTIKLPTEILEWRLASIGGAHPPFKVFDVWPDFKYFVTRDQTWYQPFGTTGSYTAGNVAFTFKIPAKQYALHTFFAGNYSLAVTHNYGSSSFYAIEFTPNEFNVILAVPAAVQWLSSSPAKYVEISSLNPYRSSAPVTFDLQKAELGQTVDFNLMAKASSANIQFTSSKGTAGTRPVSSIRLGTANSVIPFIALSDKWKNYTGAGAFNVAAGNRSRFQPQLSITATDLKNHFFQAGTYSFQLNLDAKSTDNSISAPQNTDVILKVLPLSEITVPAAGQTVNFTFNTADSYRSGQSRTIPNHLMVSNNENFEVYVKTDSEFFKAAGVQSDIRSGILQLGVDGSTLVPLSITPQKILSNAPPVLDRGLDIKYSISAGDAQNLIQKEKKVYSANVVYSFTAL